MNQTNETTNAAFDKGMRAGTGAKMRVKMCIRDSYSLHQQFDGQFTF